MDYSINSNKQFSQNSMNKYEPIKQSFDNMSNSNQLLHQFIDKANMLNIKIKDIDNKLISSENKLHIRIISKNDIVRKHSALGTFSVEYTLACTVLR